MSKEKAVEKIEREFKNIKRDLKNGYELGAISHDNEKGTDGELLIHYSITLVKSSSLTSGIL